MQIINGQQLKVQEELKIAESISLLLKGKSPEELNRILESVKVIRLFEEMVETGTIILSDK